MARGICPLSTNGRPPRQWRKVSHTKIESVTFRFLGPAVGSADRRATDRSDMSLPESDQADLAADEPTAADRPAKGGSADTGGRSPLAVLPVDEGDEVAHWHRRVVDRSLGPATRRSIDRGASLIRAAATLLERSDGAGFTVQEVADEAGQSLRTLYQYFESKDDLLLAVFEEAMRTYARMVRDAIAGLDDPFDRLTGAVIAAARMSERSRPGFDASLARLRFDLGQVDPGLVGRSQEPLISLFRDLYHQAVAAGRIVDRGEQGAVYLLLAINRSYITSRTTGNEYGVDLPDHEGYARFCLQGLGAALDDGWFERVNDQLVIGDDPQ
jgi:AcrR family transcriptional regulator